MEEDEEWYEEQMSNSAMKVRKMYCDVVEYAQRLSSSDIISDTVICPQCLKFGHFCFQCSHTYDESQASYNNGDATSESLEYVIFEGAHELLIHIISRMTSEDNFLLEMAYETLQHILWYCQEHFSKNVFIMKSKACCKAVVPEVNRLQNLKKKMKMDKDPTSESDEDQQFMELEDFFRNSSI
jgi:hypothetical protein